MWSPKTNKISGAPASGDGEDWQSQMRGAFTDPTELFAFLNLRADQAPDLIDLKNGFPFLVTRYFAEKMERQTWDDPLLRQVLPLKRENETPPGFGCDPVGDRRAERIPGLLHKYPGRVLLTPTPACAIHCRYCFRREFPYHTLTQTKTWKAAMDYLKTRDEIHEVIFSGGDPWMLNNGDLEFFLTNLQSLSHIHTIRFHTRIPLVLPARVDREMLKRLAEVRERCQVVVVIHGNHPAELEGETGACLRALRNTGALMLNQSVLLKGVNDNVSTLQALHQKLMSLGVLPYYLHQLDKVQGSHHFEVPPERGLQLIRELRQSNPGYAVPRYVKEVAGETSKTLLA